MDKERQQYLHSQIPLLINELNQRLIERDELSRLVVLVMLSKSNMFLMGERGVAKSKTVELVNGAIAGATFWQLQVNADTKHEELFGAKTSTADGNITYAAKRSILNTHYAVLDEMFKAPSERLNSLLELLVDRSYTSGDGIKRKTPNHSTFGTSNEFPTETYMLPYVDRFDYWYEVKRIEEPENRKRYYAGDYVKTPIENQYLTLEDIAYINDVKNEIKIPHFMIELFHSITLSFITQKVKTSDRKYERILNNSMRISAFLNNRDHVNISDIFLLLHSAWHDEGEKYKVNRVVFEEIFGNKEAIQLKIIESKQFMDAIDAEKNSIIYNYLNYKEKLDSIDNQATFQYIKNLASNYSMLYLKQKRDLESLLDKYSDNLQIETLIEANLFVYNFKQNAFTVEMVQSINELIEKINKRTFELNDWLKHNATLFDYQNNRIQTNRE